MKAIIWTKYGPPSVLKLEEIQKPLITDDTILVKVKSIGLAAGDCELRNLKLPRIYAVPIRLLTGWSKPSRVKILGQQYSGTIESVGKNIQNYKVGDNVFGATGVKFGAYAEYVLVKETHSDGAYIAKKPENISFQEAASSALSATEAISFLRQSGIKQGDKVLIIGGGGSIGSFAVQLAKKYFGATFVAVVDSQDKHEMLKSIGADQTIDYVADKEYWRKDIGTPFDAILDVPGIANIQDLENWMKPHAKLAKGMFGFSELCSSLFRKFSSDKKLVCAMAADAPLDFTAIADMLAKGELKSIVTRTFSLEDMAKAHEFQESGQKIGNIAINV
jgi:NADPH:quinone reductase-like Zn-dependent oxidoreductase